VTGERHNGMERATGRAREQARYHVRTKGFEGPFDVLLHLVMKQQVDIMEIDLGQLTQDYLDYLEERREVGLELTTEFLQVAALLLAIKASVLGVEDTEESDMPETAEELLTRLRELAVMKDAARRLAELIEQRSRYLSRGTRGFTGASVERIRLARVKPSALAEIYRRLRARATPISRSSHIITDTLLLEQAFAVLRAAFAASREKRFSELAREAKGRAGALSLFYALLLLAREEKVVLEQAEPLGDIVVRAHDGSGM
jgi:segregation and condensation protein A